MKQNYKSIPATELRWVRQITESGDTFLITSDQLRNKYTLWKQNGTGFQKVTTGATPDGFEKYIK